MNREACISRRRFLQKTTSVGAAVGFSGGPAVARAGAGRRVAVGVIGCGVAGQAHIDSLLRLARQGLVDLAAVCDVRDRRLQAAKARTGARGFQDFRRLLDSRDVDAVVIATPDRRHASMTIAAAEAGKDVYCEKPMTPWESLEEAGDVLKAVARNDRVVQVGAQEISAGRSVEARQRIAAGTLGPVVRAQATAIWRGPIGSTPWTGQRLAGQPTRPTCRSVARRSASDAQWGVCASLFPELLAPIVFAVGLGLPKRVAASAGLYRWPDGRETPEVSNLVIEYPSGPAVCLAIGLAADAALPMQIVGEQGTLTFRPAGFDLASHGAGEEAVAYAEPNGRPASPIDEHWRDFLNAIHTRRKPRCHEILSYRIMTTLHAGARSFREQTALPPRPTTGD
ncbi:MAG: Gfo/Idh/MocA family protein [Planctomycetota bacterium]